jgi:hypothetical protein
VPFFIIGEFKVTMAAFVFFEMVGHNARGIKPMTKKCAPHFSDYKYWFGFRCFHNEIIIKANLTKTSFKRLFLSMKYVFLTKE